MVYRCALTAADRERVRQQSGLQPSAGSTDSRAQQVTFLPPGSAFNNSSHAGCVVVVLNLGLQTWPSGSPLRVPLPALLPTGTASQQWTVSVRTDSQQWFTNFTGVGAQGEVLPLETDAQGQLLVRLAIGPWAGVVLTPVAPPPAGPSPGLSSVTTGLLATGIVLAAGAAAAWWGVRRQRTVTATQRNCRLRFPFWRGSASHCAPAGLLDAMGGSLAAEPERLASTSSKAERAALLADKQHGYGKALSIE